ncbi:hypothetical protein E1B28_009676 [Marasmius oreades]|uniref:Uncharacterized protein n=1 Tax=Marasmius oreades TaxID=181124 RepID=A0A9P7RVK8_9AGAR|nr:uncharacterized protein E1B28_009676 [Marasmius oreades]KAG7090569.1 hypothetical protein E1B28_009676 [Marasmius oreades]
MPAIPPSDIPKTAGPILLGYLLNYGLHGVLTVQTYNYYNAFPNDPTKVKAVVYGVYILETIQTVMITWDAFQYFAFGFGDASVLSQENLVWFDGCIMDGAVAFVVQTYYAHRIHLLSKSKVLMGVIVLMALVQFGGAIATAAIGKMVGQFSNRDKDFVAAGIWLGGSAACDIVIAVSMTYILSSCDPGYQDTKDVL